MVSTGRTVIPSSSEIAVPILFVPRSMASTRIKESIEEHRASEQGFWFLVSGFCLPFPIVQPKKDQKRNRMGRQTRNQEPETRNRCNPCAGQFLQVNIGFLNLLRSIRCGSR